MQAASDLCTASRDANVMTSAPMPHRALQYRNKPYQWAGGVEEDDDANTGKCASAENGKADKKAKDAGPMSKLKSKR